MTNSVSMRRASLLTAAAASTLFALAACESPGASSAAPAAAPSAVPSSASAAVPTAAPAAPAAVGCGAPAGAAWVFVSSAAGSGDGGADLAVSDTRVTCSPDGLDPIVDGAGGTGARTVHLAADAAVHLLTPDNRLADGTAADVTGLFAAHSAGRSGTGAFGWKGNVFTVRLDDAGRAVFLGQGPWSTLNTAPPK
ncbi:hypothetical protein BX265_0223 [Streptomyces sp. TLI_235]|nr:hypothetical protein [Streptomyces sp. TLI_235]PBC75555.1 hypothetical protein BX265_0223 [Streptomyces sp. TLI_235]